MIVHSGALALFNDFRLTFGLDDCAEEIKSVEPLLRAIHSARYTECYKVNRGSFSSERMRALEALASATEE